jgi:5-methylcytosine-specific restriction enzyme subunit McrC
MSERRLVVHEHQRLVVSAKGKTLRPGEHPIDESQWELLSKFTERTRSPAFKIGHCCLTVGHHVGYLQVGGVRMEILPKLSRTSEADWRGLLVHMLREVLGLRISVQEPSPLRSRAGSLYDVLIERYLLLVERILHEGPACDYREIEANEPCLRGRLLVHRQVRENVGHEERLCVAYPVLDADTLPNRILRAGLDRVLETTPDGARRSTAQALSSEFPETERLQVRPADFDHLRLDRRTVRYGEALELARLILLSERPDLRWSGKDVVSLLFDMNALFEAYVLRQLHRLPGVRVRAQARGVFWKSVTGGARRTVKPDILVTPASGCGPIVMDTKWKVPEDSRPGDEDLRQLFAYLKTFHVPAGLLVYPRATDNQKPLSGAFVDGGFSGGTWFVDLFKDGKPDAGMVRGSLREAMKMTQAGGDGAADNSVC